ncbi:MAG: hypothetical protein CVV27_11185 [Candidatus Melainabacteria bacterium HGW-Melainabacteria-1]|nr:MAG: hypothetical protein CVV27_11185 [Candidatus Melainabacteria bacterium HGW-Melainabacteria-1]
MRSVKFQWLLFLLALGACYQRPAAQNGDIELRLPTGFRASVFADGVGPARHLVVRPNGHSAKAGQWTAIAL